MTGIADELTLTQLEEVGVTARILQFELNPAALDLVVFVRVEEDAALLAALNQE
jgi:hypothetical protein